MTACTIPAIGVRPPLLILVIVRAMAPVAGIPPKMGEAMLAIPCPISSVFELWWSPITPSATVADSSDSMAPSTAIVTAGPTNPLIVSHVSSGTTAPGRVELMLKRSPMVSMVVTPAYSLSSRATMVMRIIATNEPGSAFSGDRWNIRASMGQEAMSVTLNIPTIADHVSMVPICAK